MAELTAAGWFPCWRAVTTSKAWPRRRRRTPGRYSTGRTTASSETVGWTLVRALALISELLTYPHRNLSGSITSTVTARKRPPDEYRSLTVAAPIRAPTVREGLRK